MSDLLNWYSTSYENSQKSDQCLKGCQHGSLNVDLSRGTGVLVDKSYFTSRMYAKDA